MPENPPPATKDQQQKEILDTSVKTVIDKQQKPRPLLDQPTKTKHKHKGVTDLAEVKDLSTHELSVVSIYSLDCLSNLLFLATLCLM